MAQLFYRCNKCNDVIYGDTKKILRYCTCGSMGIDGNFSSSRILGSLKNITIVESPSYQQVYKLKQIDRSGKGTGLYYRGRGEFSMTGKVYTRMPSLKWAPDCVIESFLLVDPKYISDKI